MAQVEEIKKYTIKIDKYPDGTFQIETVGLTPTDCYQLPMVLKGISERVALGEIGIIGKDAQSQEGFEVKRTIFSRIKATMDEAKEAK